MTTKLFNAIKVSILAIVLSFGLSYALAWTAPTATPPTGNVSAPINTSATLQQKSGDLTVKNFMADMVNIGLPLNPNAITAPKFCIGVSCITAWPAVGGGGTVTSLSAGAGITLSPNPITTTGTITNSGVTSIIAGTNVTLSPAGGTGAVTVTAVGSTSVYLCPAVGDYLGCLNTCKGQLTTASSCVKKRTTACDMNDTYTCSYVGKVMP